MKTRSIFQDRNGKTGPIIPLLSILLLTSGILSSCKIIGQTHRVASTEKIGMEKEHSLSSAQRITFRGQSFDTYIVSLEEHEIRLFCLQGDSVPFRNIRRLRSSLAAEGRTLLFGMNAGMYKKDRSPLGLYIEEGELKVPLNQHDGYGNFYLKPNGVFMIRGGQASVVESSQFRLSDDILYATQSGPLLLQGGDIHPVFREGSKSLHIRNGVGIIDSKTIVFIISNQPVNFYDFASIFKDQFGCKDALYLDGAISKMYLPDLNRSDLGGNLGPLIGILK